MMRNWRKRNIIQDIRNLFRLRTRTKLLFNWRYKKSFKTKKKLKQLKILRIFRDIKNLFQFEKEDIIDNDQEPVIHSKSDNIDIIISDRADEIIKELFSSVKNRCQSDLESMKGGELVFDYVKLIYYKRHKMNQILVDYM